MKTRHSKFLVILTILFVTCSCGARKGVVREQRYLQTGMQEEDAIVILLNEFLEHGNKAESESKESYIEKCMAKVMVSENPNLRIIAAKKFRDSLFPGKSFIETPRSPEALLPYVCHDTVKSQIVQLGVRYIVIVNITTYNTGKHLVFDYAASGGKGGGVAGGYIGQSWERNSTMDARILDVRLQDESGLVSASSSGKCGYAVPLFFIIPLPPVPWFSRTESKACSALGKATIEFIEGRGHSKPE